MPSFTDIGDGPAILKLAKWDHLPYHLKLSELSEVSLSPTKKLLLLLSCQSEALLLPLTGLQCSYSLKEDASRFCHSDQSLRPNKFTEHLTSAPASKINSAESFEDSCEVSSASFDSCTLISNVKTFAWGHYGDSYSHFKQSDFKEFFIVCSDNGIIFHSFRYLNKEYQEHSFFNESGPFTGHWVQWGPSSDIHTEEQFSNIHEYEQKRWLQTFHTEVDASWHGRKYLARFPMKSSYPQSAAVLSFDIKHATLNFLDSCHTTHPLDETKLDFEVPVSAVLSPPLPSSQANLHSAGSHIGCSYKFIRVFSGSLHSQLGFVLTCAEHTAVENELQKCGHTIVVIIMLHHWGLEWLCSVKLENSYLPGPGSDWADFQILESLLVCLGTSGLISIWCTKTGNPIVSIDIVRTCQANENAPSWLNELKISGIDSSRNEIMRNFRNLMVAPNSLLLAASDEHGVIYVIDANDYISEHQPNKIVSLSQPSELGVLGNWNVAGKGIGCPKVFAYISNSLCFNALESSYGNLPNHKHNIVFRHGKRLRKHNIDKENFLDGYRDGFNNLSQRNTHLETCYSKKESISISKLRRIHLPPNHHSTNDPVCFSLFGVTRLIGYYAMTGEKLYNFSHTDLHVSSTFVDDRNLNDFWWYKRCCFKKDIFAGESFGFSFKGFLYAVTQEGLFVILPSVSFTCSQPLVESARHCQPSAACRTHLMNYSLAVNDPPAIWKPWQMEVFDKTLFFEGSEEAEAICSNNGWDLRIARLRRMQLGLHYLKFDEISESLDMLADANLAEEGILHLLFTAAHMLFCKNGNDNEVSLASRLLDMAACFATKIIRKYGSAEYMKPQFLSCCEHFGSSYIWKHQHYPKLYESSNSHRLSEMALLLEGIRNIQNQLGSKDRRVLLDKRDGRDMNDMVDGEILQNSMLPITSNDPVSLIMSDFVESQPHTSALQYNENEDLTASANSNLVNFNVICVPEANPNARNKLLALENPKETIVRWKLDSLDLNSVVKEALLSGRLPLAVLQVHLQRYGDQMDEKQHFDNFAEVCDIGRAIAYELFAKGESALALETLLRLGEDIELILMQLLFGTVRRSLRAEIAKEMESYGYLRRHERKILERISLIERLYPSSSFWLTYHWKLKDGAPSNINQEISKKELKFVMHDNLVIECGDIDGVILGSWANLDDDPAFLVVDEEKVHTGYWACAATWADAWDQLTIDRVLLDRPNNAGVVTSWESQLEFHLSHHNFKDVYKLFEVIPPYLLSEEILKINLNYSNFCSDNKVKTQHHSFDICAPGEVEPVCLNFPKIKILRFSAVLMCSSWLKMLVEQELAKKYIFLRDHWDSIAELIHLFGCAGLIIKASKISDNPKLSCSSQDLAAEKFCEPAHNDISEALHRLTLCYCIQYNLPHFLNLYLDHHNVALDDTTLCTLREAAVSCPVSNEA